MHVGPISAPGLAAKWPVALVALGIALAPALAAGQASVAVVDIDIEGELDLELLDQVSAAVESGIGPAAEAVIAHDIVAETVRQAGMSVDCVDGPCLADIGELTEAEVLLRVRLNASSQLYEIEAELLLARNGRSLGRGTGSCAVCTWDEALAGVTTTVTELRTAMPGRVLFQVTPPEALLLVDGESVDAAEPLLLGSGAHQVEASHPGLETLLREITVEAGAEQTVELELVTDAPGDRPAWRSVGLWGWVLGGAGLAALVPGALWLGIDGTCAIGAETVDGICSDLWDTRTEGGALTVVAGSLVATGIVLLVVHYARRRPRAAGARYRFLGALPHGPRAPTSVY